MSKNKSSDDKFHANLWFRTDIVIIFFFIVSEISKMYQIECLIVFTMFSLFVQTS